jgi:hemoglobin
MDKRVDRRTVTKGAIGGAIAGALLPAAGELAAAQGTPEAVAPTTAPAQPAEATLFERLGGIFAIAAVVDRFSDEIIKNPKLNVNPNLKAWNENEAATRLPGLKFGRTQWIAAMAGAPIEYTGLPLSEAHDRFDLTPLPGAGTGKARARRGVQHCHGRRGGELLTGQRWQ